ncbi:MAG: HD domain-containing protein [Myxococcaceae bacterium]|nr:HD domain-containing protein [Myxococcaceae bacterium]
MSASTDANLPAEGEVETIRKVYVKDLREKQTLHTVFKVTRKTRQTARSGRSFLALALGDRTGEIDARVFDNVDAIEPTFVENDYVLVKGSVILWQKRPQVVIESIERLDPEPIDPEGFRVPPPAETPAAPAPAPAAPSPPAALAAEKEKKPAEERREKAPQPGPSAGDRVVAQIREQVERVQDGHVRALLLSFLDDPDIAPTLPIAPAAKGIHHAYRGGLADHILSVIKLAHRIADHYPMVDRDLLVAGALLHDICKVQEIVPNRSGGFEYTDQGRLVGHLVMCAQKIHEKAARLPGFPALLEHHLTHIVLAHHGQLDWGSPKVPMTLEAQLVHLIDTIDSRVASWLEIMERDELEGNWTETTRLYDRHLWKGPAPTARRRSPLEGRPSRRNRGKKKDKGGGFPSFKPLAQIAATALPEAPPKPALDARPDAEPEGASDVRPDGEPA